MSRLSIRAKIISALLITGLFALAAGGIIGFRSGKDALTQSVSRQLVAQREVKRHLIESYVRTQLRFTEAVGRAPLTIAATKALIDAFHEMHAVVAAEPVGQKADTVALEAWYSKSFAPRLDKVAGSHESLEELMPIDPVGRRLQADYIARNPAAVGRKDELLTAPGGSPYDAVHGRIQGPMQRVAQMVGFYDINLVDAATGDVIYTIEKEPDFGSNMFLGSFARSAFGRVVQRALDPRNGGRAVVEDFSAYEPSAFMPQLFTGVPVVADGKTIGVLVAQIDIAA